MWVLRETCLLFIITFLGLSIGEECEDIKPVLSKCYDLDKYRWLIQIPQTETACNGKSITKPVSVPCNLNCAKGAALDRETLKCRKCSEGSYSLGGGQQYTFNTLNNLDSLPSEMSYGATGFMDYYDINCNKKELWQIKGNVLQGDVRPNCAIMFSLRFKLVRPGSITITYNLPTSSVFGTIKSRCDFTTDDSDDDDDNDPRKETEFRLFSTGYGIWKSETKKISDAGEYRLMLFTVSLTAFHFPFAIRSIIVEGSKDIEDCLSCEPGTYAANPGADTCKPCPANTYASEKGSTECLTCKADEYSDEESSKCIKRPTCGAKDYRKVFKGCDVTDKATVTYELIKPQICMDGGPPSGTETMSCGSCNPGMYEKKDSHVCEFCPANTYSNGTLAECIKCDNELSLLPGLYYEKWRELPIYFNRSFMSFRNLETSNQLTQDHSWIPSISYISSQPIPDTLSVLSLTIVKGFRITEIAKSTKEYGTLYFKFSAECQSSCTLFLVYRDIFDDISSIDDDDDYDDWEVVNKWTIDQSFKHEKKIEYTYSIQHPDKIEFDWLFSSDTTKDGLDEVRIYEIRVTNTQVGGSDRCVACLTANDQQTQCKSCTPGYILYNNTCIPCQLSTIASRVRPNDPVPTICKPCPNNTISDDGISCYTPCKQAFNGCIEYDLNGISTLEFHGSKLFTQKGSGYFHIFNASICGKTTVTCSKTPSSLDSKRSPTQKIIDSKLCRLGSVPDKNGNYTSVAYIDEFGEQLLNVSLLTLKYFPSLRSDYNLTDITLVYRANATAASQATCTERITFLSLRCDHILEEDKPNSTLKYQLQSPNDCSSGTCDGCTFYFLLRTPFACPTCDENTNGFRTFFGPCKFGRQEVRKIPYPYCSHKLKEKVETRRCSILSLEIQIIIGLFIIIAGILISVVIFCWRKNRKLEYRYMQLIENNNPDDDTPVDNVCAQLSDEEDSGEEVQFKKQSKAKKILNVVRKAIRKNSNNERSDMFNGDSFLLTASSTNDA